MSFGDRESMPSWAEPEASPTSMAHTEFTITPPSQSVSMGVSSSSNNDNVLLQPYSTLDEPIRETILRDVYAVSQKLRIVLLPLDRNKPLSYIGIGMEDDSNNVEGEYGVTSEQDKKIISTLREWDLWGPLFICLLTSVLLSIEAKPSQSSAVFAVVFVLVWVGAAVVTVNAQLLGGSISFFQSVCVLGYCVFPITLAAIVISLLRRTPLGLFWLDLLWVGIGFVWSTRASTIFIGQYIVAERRALAVFPVFFFYTFLAWMIMLI